MTAYTGHSGLRVEAIATTASQKTGNNASQEVAKASGTGDNHFYLPIPSLRFWSPDDPFLYGLKLQLKDKKEKVIDEIDSYFGMRSVSLGKVDGVNRPLLNGEFGGKGLFVCSHLWPVRMPMK